MNSTERPVVLVVDDTPGNIDVIKGCLKNEYVIRPAINGELALRLAATEPLPDLILLDIMMPEMSGYDFIRAYRTDHNTPIILLTAGQTVLGLPPDRLALLVQQGHPRAAPAHAQRGAVVAARCRRLVLGGRRLRCGCYVGLERAGRNDVGLRSNSLRVGKRENCCRDHYRDGDAG